MKRIFGRFSGALFLGLVLVVSSAMIGCGKTTINDNTPVNDRSWTKSLEAVSFISGPKVTMDSMGNFYVVSESCVVKYKPNGEQEKNWKLAASGYGITLNSKDNCYVTGITSSSLDMQPLNGDGDLFVTKYDSNGVKNGTVLYGESYCYYWGVEVAADDVGNFFVIGNYDQGSYAGDGYGGVIIKYDSQGKKVWSIDVFLGRVNGVVLDKDRKYCYVTGYVGNLGPNGEKPIGYDDAFIAKYSLDGKLVSSKLIGTADKSTEGTGIVLDKDGNCYIVGNVGDYVDLKMVNSKIFISKIDDYNQIKNIKYIGIDGKNLKAEGITLDNSGNLYITGSTDDDMDGEKRTGLIDGFVTKYTSDLTRLSTTLFNIDNKRTYGTGIAVDSTGRYYVTGVTKGNPDDYKTWDAFITKIVPKQ